MSLSTLAYGVLPWAVGFHGMYWVCRAISHQVSPTYRSLEESKKGYWASSWSCNVSSLIMFGLAVKALAVTPAFLTTEDFYLCTPASLRCSQCFLGYIVSDCVLAAWYRSQWDGWVQMLLHHGFILYSWAQMISGEYGQLFAIVGALCEGSTPFVNFRWILSQSGMQKSPLYVPNGLAMLGSFFLLRVVGFLWMGTRIAAQREGLLKQPALNVAVLLSAFAVGTGLQLFWFYKMAFGALKMLGLIGSKKKDKETR